MEHTIRHRSPAPNAFYYNPAIWWTAAPELLDFAAGGGNK